MEKIHSTNYFNSFIEVAEDCNASSGEIPPYKEISVPWLQYELLSQNPYRYTSDDVLFHVYSIRNDLTGSNLVDERKRFFSKGQACLRCSPLAKKFGWGIHHDEQGKIALVGRGTEDYRKLLTDDKIKKVKAMRSSRKN